MSDLTPEWTPEWVICHRTGIEKRRETLASTEQFIGAPSAQKKDQAEAWSFARS
jgi:hypothetical protein